MAATTSPLRIAVLDDYQGIAETVDWSAIPRPVDLLALREHIAPATNSSRGWPTARWWWRCASAPSSAPTCWPDCRH